MWRLYQSHLKILIIYKSYYLASYYGREFNMKFIKRKLIILGLLSVVLTACGTSTDTTEENAVEAESNATNENTTETSIVADEITTTFEPKVTKLRVLTDEDEAWYDIIMTRLNAIDDYSGDRDTVYEIAEEYGEDPEDLWENWLEIADAKFYSDMGEYAILTNEFNQLIDEILYENLVGDQIDVIGGQSDMDEETFTSFHNYEVEVDGVIHEVQYKVKYEENYQVAEITEFKVDGDEIEL